MGVENLGVVMECDKESPQLKAMENMAGLLDTSDITVILSHFMVGLNMKKLYRSSSSPRVYRKRWLLPEAPSLVRQAAWTDQIASRH